MLYYKNHTPAQICHMELNLYYVANMQAYLLWELPVTRKPMLPFGAIKTSLLVISSRGVGPKLMVEPSVQLTSSWKGYQI